MKTKSLLPLFGIALVAVCSVILLFFMASPRGQVAAERLTSSDPELQKTKTEIIAPIRGDILDCKGRVIATNKTVWDVYLDCTVLDVTAEEWNSLTGDLSKELETILGEKTAQEYYEMLSKGRFNCKKYLRICEDVADSSIVALKQATLLKMGRYRGGSIFTPRCVRSYPYGSLGRRTIGYSSPTHAVGIDGAYDMVLSGETGTVEYSRKCKKGVYFWMADATVPAVDGKDVTASLDMDMMAAVESQLRAALVGESDVRSACAVVMDVKTGAVAAMSNLSYGFFGDSFDEVFNLSIGNQYEPGTVLTALPREVLETGLKDASIDIEGLRDVKFDTDKKGQPVVSCTPLHVLRIYAGIANGGVMFNPYLVTPSKSTVLCSAAVAGKLKSSLAEGRVSTAAIPVASVGGTNVYKYHSGESEYASTWAGFFSAGGKEYALVCAAFSKRVKGDAPQMQTPEKAAKGILEQLSSL